MKKVIYRADTRGHADHGWLKSYHTFSFGSYFDPERMNFGVLRVLNDDSVMGGMGFSTHPHSNMEIISIPLEGDLEHKDSLGNVSIIREGDIQVMSAGTGVEHSEFNKSVNKPVKFLQIWIFPNKSNVQPRYDQISLQQIARANEMYQVLSPNENDQGVWIHQNAWFHLGKFDQDTTFTHDLNLSENGLFVFVLKGKLEIDNTILNSRDALGISETSSLEIKAYKNSEVLIMEVPMHM